MVISADSQRGRTGRHMVWKATLQGAPSERTTLSPTEKNTTERLYIAGLGRGSSRSVQSAAFAGAGCGILDM